MAAKRMFSLAVVDSDIYLEMPGSAQNLYFHLGMRADDDGFVDNPKKIMRMVRNTEDDMKILLTKRFLIAFESGVVLIRHWRINNYLRTDRYKETRYLKEKNRLCVLKNGEYELLDMVKDPDDILGLPFRNQVVTQRRLEENSEGYKREDVVMISEGCDHRMDDYGNSKYLEKVQTHDDILMKIAMERR